MPQTVVPDCEKLAWNTAKKSRIVGTLGNVIAASLGRKHKAAAGAMN